MDTGLVAVANNNSIETGRPIVIVKDALVFTQYGKMVAAIDASYDFSGLPVDLHEQAIGIASGNRVNLCLQVDQYQANEKQSQDGEFVDKIGTVKDAVGLPLFAIEGD